MSNERITHFRGDYLFLSNFYSIRVYYEQMWFPSTEHAYHAMKTSDTRQRFLFSQTHPKDLKKLSKTLHLPEGWDTQKLVVMDELLKIKFAYPRLAVLLERTGDAEIEEENWWNDQFWGTCRGVGQNHLGRLLMQVRDYNRTHRPYLYGQ